MSCSSSESSDRLGEVLTHEGPLAQLVSEIRRIVESVIANETAKLHQSLVAHQVGQSGGQLRQSSASTTGVEVTAADKLRAVDLRAAFFLGKLPEDAGLLIDIKTTARLLNISPRMLYSLNQVQAIPEPIRLGRVVRWRLAEIIEWIDSDCPPRHRWTYSAQRASGKRKAR